MSIGNRIRQITGTGILSRFTLLFVGTILVPSLVILAYSVTSTSRETRERVLLTSESVAADIYDSVRDAVSAGADLAQQIAFDTGLRQFLNDPFENTGAAALEFMQETRPCLLYTSPSPRDRG